MVIAAIIASFGLVANSTAVVIGAMLVSPLMTPIFGIALGMLRGDTKLYSGALTAEFVGMILAIAAAYLLGLFGFVGDRATPEMIARTAPNLIDLFVALFAGFAGAYALVDERISPALPGVAIATAIVPPLATVGLCLALGAYAGAAGALLLFLANFVTILVVALITFGIAGFAVNPTQNSWKQLARRFGPSAVGFIIVAVVLTNSLIQIIRERTITNTIQNVLSSELVGSDRVALQDFQNRATEGRMQVLATIRAPSVIRPNRVEELQELLAKRLEMPVDLVVRTSLAHDVAPTGSRLRVTKPNLNGSFLTTDVSDEEAKVRVAEQVIREMCDDEPGFELVNVDYGMTKKNHPLLLATMVILREMTGDRIQSLEHALRKRLEDPDLGLVVRYTVSRLAYEDGPIHLRWTNLSDATDEETAAIPAMENIIREEINRIAGVFPVKVFFNKKKNQPWRILAEVVGPHSVTPDEVIALEKAVSQRFNKSINMNLSYRSSFIVNANGYGEFEEFTRPILAEAIGNLPKIFRPALSQAR